jgi:hypothetical protein
MLVAVAIVALFPGRADAAPDGDSVVGTGVIEIPNPLAPGSTVPIDISLDAHSDASGGNPTGTVLVTLTAASLTLYSGPVTCLAVTGNTAIIGFDDVSSGHVIFEVVDNSALGTPDTIGLNDADPTGCSLPESPVASPLVYGDFVVHDALTVTSKGQCKNGGWRNFTDDKGQPFASQGVCIAFVQKV